MEYLILLTFISSVMCQTLPQRTLDALERALNFVNDDCEDFNVDGVFGVTLAEGKCSITILIVRLKDNAIISTSEDAFERRF